MRSCASSSSFSAAVISRAGFTDNDGLSFYGEHADTIVP
jgi:hypothetical protein